MNFSFLPRASVASGQPVPHPVGHLLLWLRSVDATAWETGRGLRVGHVNAVLLVGRDIRKRAQRQREPE